jgi:HAD superfamily hydrolase (TIGR01484 family)
MKSQGPRGLDTFEREAAAAIAGVFTDLDDTLTTAGRITAASLAAMERLRAAGLLVVLITGRPAGWCDHFARMWPVDAVVGENGAFYFRYLEGERRMVRRYIQSADERADGRRRLEALKEKVLAEVPGAAVASDQAYREADLAIDFREDVAPLPVEQVARIAEIFRQGGAEAKISSIHVNAWFGDYDKIAMTKVLMSEVFDVDLTAEEQRYSFVGDSPNDAPMFGFFSHSVGVANVLDFEGRLETWPAYITQAAGGQGFCDLADHLLSARQG